MTWTLPGANAVTLGEIDGELYSVTPRDEYRLRNEFIRRGGSILPLARVTNLKQRRPFGQEESLTEQDDDGDNQDTRAVQLVKKFFHALHVFFLDDEYKAVQMLKKATTSIMDAAFIRPVGQDQEDSSAFLDPTSSRIKMRQERIVTIAWFPSQLLLAVARRDGVISLYDVLNGQWEERVLEHRGQTDITAMALARYSCGVIAVACRGGIYLWKIAIGNKTQEPELLHVYTHPMAKVFTHLVWNEDGSRLAAFAKNSSTIHVFDVTYHQRTELECSIIVSGLDWSPNGEYLFVSTASSSSILWETCTWTKEIWNVAAASYAWASHSRCLLVSPRDSSLIYPYEFKASPPLIDISITTPPIDFAEKHMHSLDQSTNETVGGQVQCMVWDPTASRLAVTYMLSDSTSEDEIGPLVAIFATTWKPFLIFTRIGLIRGPQNAGIPRTIAFAPHYKQGALLSIAWSHGMISFHPLHFTNE